MLTGNSKSTHSAPLSPPSSCSATIYYVVTHLPSPSGTNKAGITEIFNWLEVRVLLNTALQYEKIYLHCSKLSLVPMRVLKEPLHIWSHCKDANISLCDLNIQKECNVVWNMWKNVLNPGIHRVLSFSITKFMIIPKLLFGGNWIFNLTYCVYSCIWQKLRHFHQQTLGSRSSMMCIAATVCTHTTTRYSDIPACVCVSVLWFNLKLYNKPRCMISQNTHTSKYTLFSYVSYR